MKFLQRDFSHPEHKTAAKKNAYALLGKRRFDYAASFFLLADDPASATNVLAGQCSEVMLAIAVARLYSGDGSPVLRRLLEDRILPDAIERGDRWLMCWCYRTLNRQDQAADVLLRPLDGVRTWQQDDPDTLSLCASLRRAAPEYEWEAVLRAARVLRRMGLWLPALELVRMWRFQPPQTVSSATRELEEAPHGIRAPASMFDELAHAPNNEAPPATVATSANSTLQVDEVPSMLDGFTSPTPVIDEKAAREAKAAELLAKLKAKKMEATSTVVVDMKKPKPPPTQFKEPDPNSLLDSFGF